MALAFSLSHLGTILVSVVGLLFAVLKREQLGRVARWAIGGFGLFLLYSFVGVAARTGLEVYRIENNAGPTDDTYEFWMVLTSVATALLYTAAFIVIARSIFLDRTR
jgi:hypothetical protein